VNGRVFRLALAALSVAPSAGASPPGRFVSIQRAKALAYEALTPREKGAAGLSLETNPSRPGVRFLYVSVYWRNPFPEGSAVVTNLAVDTRTGDVWSAAICEERVNPRLRKLQARVRRQLGVSPTEYARLKIQGPACEG
jgi:hypothetical protein